MPGVRAKSYPTLISAFATCDKAKHEAYNEEIIIFLIIFIILIVKLLTYITLYTFYLD